MINTDNGFAKFVPGYEFLQNLAKGASGSLPQMPSLTNWVAPSLNVEELDKRIDELKAVHFWLDQNSKALSATIQALEVQKLTLATLKGMNFDLSDVANALKMKPIEPAEASPAPAAEPEEAGQAQADAARAGKAARAGAGAAPKGAKAGHASKATKTAKAQPSDAGSARVDPLQLWGALTQQFQQIAATALKDVGKGNPMAAAATAATAPAKASRARPAASPANPPANPPATPAANRRAPAQARPKR